MDDHDQAPTLKAATLLSRLLLCAAEDIPIYLNEQQAQVIGNGLGFIYEGCVLTAQDVLRAALMVCAGLASDLADARDVEMGEVCRHLDVAAQCHDIMYGALFSQETLDIFAAGD